MDGLPVSFSVRNSTLQTELTGLEHFMRYEIHVSGLTRKGAGPSGITFGGKQKKVDMRNFIQLVSFKSVF